MERKLSFAVGEYYHIYNRGVEKRNIFLDKEDKKRFVRSLYLANSNSAFVYKTVQGRPLDKIEVGPKCIAVGAYTLMPNHFHLLVKEINAGGISNFMEKLQTGYSMYFNKKNERVGPLFQGRFKATHIYRDEHLKYLFAYIHLNPITLIERRWKEEGIRNLMRSENYLARYQYSSYLDYMGNARAEEEILTPSEFPDYFSQQHAFQSFIADWLTYHNFQGRPLEEIGKI